MIVVILFLYVPWDLRHHWPKSRLRVMSNYCIGDVPGFIGTLAHLPHWVKWMMSMIFDISIPWLHRIEPRSDFPNYDIDGSSKCREGDWLTKKSTHSSFQLGKW